MNDALSDPYAEIAAFYDLEHAAFAEDLDLYQNVAQVVGDPILELGCGSGRVLVPLAQLGFRVTGVDQSKPMLERAERAVRAAAIGDRVTLVEGAMADAAAAPGGPFGLVLAPLNGLLHLAEPAAQRAALASAHRALDPRGLLVLDLLNPTPEALRSFDGSVVLEGNWALPEGGRVAKFSSRRLRESEQRIETELWYDVEDAAGNLRRVRTSYPMRYLHRAEVELLLELAGFAEWEMYGGYDLEPYSDGADRLIVLAEVTASAR